MGYDIRLVTERLVLRDHLKADFPEYYRWITDPRVMRYVGFPMPDTRGAAHRLFRSIMREASRCAPNERSRVYLAIELAESGVYVGDVGLSIKKRETAGGVGDLGYFLLPEFWRCGYTTEATRRLIKYGFTQLGLHRITAGCDLENVASKHVMEKCRLTLEGTMKKHRFREGKWRDVLKYAILRDEFRG